MPEKSLARADLMRCFKCRVRFTCPVAFRDTERNKMAPAEARCWFDLEKMGIEKSRLFKDWAAFTTNDPQALLTKIFEVYKKLEENVEQSPTYTKWMNLIYLLINLYKLKFGERYFVARVTKNLTNTTMDVKEIMEKMRQAEEQAKERVIDVKVEEVKVGGGDEKGMVGNVCEEILSSTKHAQKTEEKI